MLLRGLLLTSCWLSLVKGLESRVVAGLLLLEALEEFAREMSGAPLATLLFLRSTALEVDEFLYIGIGARGGVCLLSYEVSLRDPRLAEDAVRPRRDLLSSCEGGFVFALDDLASWVAVSP